jgi:beta-lactamase class A
MKRFLPLWAAASILAALAAAWAYGQTLPIKVPAAEWRALSQRWDKDLQIGLERALRQNARWHSLIYEKKLAVGLVDLSNPRAPRFAQVNGDQMMYAASLPKIAVLWVAFRSFEDGSLKPTPELKSQMVEMIRRSDNFASSQVINRLGLTTIAAALQDPRYRFYDRSRGGGIWVGGSYGGGEKHPEPLKDLTYAATANQVCNFYYLLAYGKLLNPEHTRQMLKILAFPDLPDKFTIALGKSVPANRLYRKSGHFRIWFSDSVLVWTDDGRRYILVALVEDPEGEKILRELPPVAEKLLRRPPATRPAGSR